MTDTTDYGAFFAISFGGVYALVSIATLVWAINRRLKAVQLKKAMAAITLPVETRYDFYDLDEQEPDQVAIFLNFLFLRYLVEEDVVNVAARVLRIQDALGKEFEKLQEYLRVWRHSKRLKEMRLSIIITMLEEVGVKRFSGYKVMINNNIDKFIFQIKAARASSPGAV